MTTTTSAPATRLLDMEDASATLPLKSFIHRESPKDHGGGNHTPLSQDHSPRYNGSGYTSQLQRPSPQYSASISPVNPTFTVDQSTDCSVSASGSDRIPSRGIRSRRRRQEIKKLVDPEQLLFIKTPCKLTRLGYWLT